MHLEISKVMQPARIPHMEVLEHAQAGCSALWGLLESRGPLSG